MKQGRNQSDAAAGQPHRPEEVLEETPHSWTHLLGTAVIGDSGQTPSAGRPTLLDAQ